jgi:hypothetical protein
MLLSLLMEEKPHGAVVTNSAKVAFCYSWNVLFCYIRWVLGKCVDDAHGQEWVGC